MRAVWVVCIVGVLLGGCSKDRSQVMEAEAFLPLFDTLRGDVASVLEVSIERNTRAFVLSNQAGQSGNPNMQKLIARAQDANPQLPLEQESSNALVSRLFQQVFWPHKEVLAARGYIVEPGDRENAFLYPGEVELPTPDKWTPLRQHRMFSAVDTCELGNEERRCVLIKLEPIGHPGSAGVTIAFRTDKQ